MKAIASSLLCLILLSGCMLIPQQSELDGTRWSLQSMHGKELIEGTVITAKFSQESISGSAGCNFYSAETLFHLRNRIDIAEVAHTEMGCRVPEGILEQEQAYISTLKAGASYRLDVESLSILDQEGKQLLQYQFLPQYESNPELLKGRTWQLIEADGMEAYELSVFTIRFDEGAFQGTTVCRDYEGRYESAEQPIHISMLSMLGDVDCSHEELMAEAAYTTLLGWVDQYYATENRLELYTVQNDRLVFGEGP